MLAYIFFLNGSPGYGKEFLIQLLAESGMHN